MDFKKELRDLENKGVFIHLSYDHYNDGTNCNFSIEFTRFENETGRSNQTGWYGDNHEFGDTADCIEAAIRFANWLLEGDRLKWYFYNPKETVTEEGYNNWLKYREFKEIADIKIFEEFNNSRVNNG